MKTNLRVEGELQEQVRQTERNAERSKWIFPEEFMKPCENKVTLEDSSIESLARATKLDKIQKKECVLRHNSLVEEIKKRQPK